MDTSSWAAVKRDYQAEAALLAAPRHATTESHPLLATDAATKRKAEAAGARSTAAAGAPPQQQKKQQDPLSDPLSMMMMDSSNPLDPLSDPAPAPRPAASQASAAPSAQSGKHDEREASSAVGSAPSQSAVPWSVKKQSILREYTMTTGSIRVTANFMSDAVGNTEDEPTLKSVDRSQARLMQLEAGTKPDGTLELTQKE